MGNDRRQGAIPYSRKYCWVKPRIQAANMVKNVLRAVRAGNCARAERIVDSSQYDRAMACSSFATKARVHRKVRDCRDR